MTNEEHASRLAAEAAAAALRRRVLLTASVALRETATVPAARKALAGFNGPPDVMAGALAVVDGLAENGAL